MTEQVNSTSNEQVMNRQYNNICTVKNMANHSEDHMVRLLL
jgi:hypothetical protein